MWRPISSRRDSTVVRVLPIIRSMDGFTSAAKLLGVLILALVASLAAGGCGTFSTNESAALERAPTGVWDATGKALVVRHIADETSGDVLNRRWLFRTECHKARCRTMFLRTAAYGTQRAVLISHHGYYTATFGPIAVACERQPGLPGRMLAHFKIWWSSNRSKLIADEQAVYGSRECDQGESKTRWTAARWAPDNANRN
jgi:hypothetical protein